jgi:hypothetical protein
VVFGLVGVALLVWAGLKWLPSDEKAIRQRMQQLVETASVKPDESNFARLAYPDRLAAFFTTNAVIHLEGLGGEFSSIGSRTDLLAAAMAARSQLRQAEFKLTSLDVTFPSEKRQANAYAVITGAINFQTNQLNQAFRLSLRKIGGRWLVEEIVSIERLQ